MLSNKAQNSSPDQLHPTAGPEQFQHIISETQGLEELGQGEFWDYGCDMQNLRAALLIRTIICYPLNSQSSKSNSLVLKIHIQVLVSPIMSWHIFACTHLF